MADEKPVPKTLDTIAEKITALGQSVDERFAQVDARFADVDQRFDEVSEAFVEQLKYTEFAFDQLRTEMNGGFNRLDRNLDRVLNTLTRTLVPRRRRRS
jgi:DNA-binding ferritin-like protein